MSLDFFQAFFVGTGDAMGISERARAARCAGSMRSPKGNPQFPAVVAGLGRL